MADTPTQHALGDRAAFQLANVTKTPPQYAAITPRWLVRLLDWKPLEAGTFRVNRVVNDEALEVACGGKDEKADFEQAAQLSGLSLSAWIRRLMRNGAREELAKIARKPSYNGDG